MSDDADLLTWLADAARERSRSGLARVTQVHPHHLVDLAGNDYLGLRRDPRVLEAAATALRDEGAGAGASRLVTGTLAVHAALEARLAEHTGHPSALVTSTGYAANLSALTTLADARTLVVSDAHVHASLVDGARLCRGTVAIARHHDLAHVEHLLATRELPRAIVVVESIYSVLGDAAPLRALADLAAAHGAVLLVDDAHGLGVVGDRGEGGVAAAGLAQAPHVVTTTTLSKALGAQGGAVLAHPAVREHLVNTARPFIYDTGLAPASAGAALGALAVLADEPERVALVRERAAEIAGALGVPAPDGAVLSALTDGPAHALDLVERAARDGVRIGCFRPPSTPDGSSRLRSTASAGTSAAGHARALRVLTDIVRQVPA